MHRVAIRWVPLSLCFALLACLASGQQSSTHNDVVITNTYVMTVTHGNLKKGSVYIKDGKIAAVGESVYKRGVKIAFAAFEAHNSRNLPYQAGFATGFGLPPDEALKAITLNAAEIWGVADQLGSLDVGKTASIVVANGDPLDVKTDVKHVFIAGQEIPMTSRQTRLRDEYSTQ